MSEPSQQLDRNSAWPSVNALSAPLVRALCVDAASLRIGVERAATGAVVVDAGIAQLGGLEAGRRIAEICLGGLGSVAFGAGNSAWPVVVNVHTANPVLACLGSQYAGWSLSAGEGKEKFRALGSGPARAIAAKEELFTELGYRDRASETTLVLEVDQAPPQAIIDKVARDCGVPAQSLTFILTPTRSLAGLTQIVARVVEVALHKAHALKFPLDRIIDAFGSAPIPPPGKDFLSAMGRSNDAILFGGTVQLFVRSDDKTAGELADKLPSSASRDFGKPFAQIFKDYGYDFYQIDPMLFAPAAVIVSNLETGRSFRAGALREDLIRASFGA